MSLDAAVYLSSALLGALVGGLISLMVSARSARRSRRARYGEALLSVLGQAHRRVAASASGASASEPLVLRDEAIELWARTELAAILERSRAGRRAMQGWGHHLHEVLSRGVSGRPELEHLEHQLDLAVYLVIAWTAGRAKGRDFLRPASEVESLFGPYDVPDYRRPPG